MRPKMSSLWEVKGVTEMDAAEVIVDVLSDNMCQKDLESCMCHVKNPAQQLNGKLSHIRKAPAKNNECPIRILP